MTAIEAYTEAMFVYHNLHLMPAEAKSKAKNKIQLFEQRCCACAWRYGSKDYEKYCKSQCKIYDKLQGHLLPFKRSEP